MKDFFDVSGHQLSRRISFLSNLVINKDYSKDMIKKEIENKFYGISLIDKEAILNQIVKRCYTNAWLVKDTGSKQKMFDCSNENFQFNDIDIIDIQIGESFVIKLAKHLINIINSNSFKLLRGNRFSSEFYDICIHRLFHSEFFNEIEDIELFTIYLKQLTIILRNCNFFICDNGIARINPVDVNNKELYLSLFTSFWRKVKWYDIFPSIPDAARELRRNRSIMLDLIPTDGNKFSIVDISNEFCALTGFGIKNNFITISFLDFYFFTWMGHFGIISHCNSNENDEVVYKVTEHGNRFIRNFCY